MQQLCYWPLRERKGIAPWWTSKQQDDIVLDADLDRDPLPHNHELKMSSRMEQNLIEEASVERNKVVVKFLQLQDMGPGYDTLGMAVIMWSSSPLKELTSLK